MTFRPALLGFLGVILVSGCGRLGWDPEKAPAGFSIIREHVVSAPRNDPPILSNLDFTVVSVDAGPVTRETIPPLVDEMPGVLVAAGTHRFQAEMIPHRRLPGIQATLVSFVATTEPGKVYMLVDKDDAPILVLSRSRPRP